jgi:hypothetical protein
VLQGGFNYEGGKEIPDGGGYRDGRGLWQLHYWVKLCGSVIDLTADQFHGGAPIVFEPDFHRYRSTFPDEHLKSVTEHQGIKLAAWLRNWAAYTNPTRARQHRFLLVRDQYPEKLLPPGLTVSEVEAILKKAQRLHPDSWISWTRVEEDKGLRPTNHPSNTRGNCCGAQIAPGQQSSMNEYEFQVSSCHRPWPTLHPRPAQRGRQGAAANSNPEGEENQPQTDHRWHEEQL